MTRHPLHDVAIVGVHNTKQARVLEGHDSRSITFEAGLGAVADAGLSARDIDGVMGQFGSDFVYQARLGPVWRSMNSLGVLAILEAAAAIAAGYATTVLVSGGSAAVYTERASTAPWTRPSNEFVAPFGMFTAAEFALMARRHMHMYGTTPEQLAIVAATIRNNGHVNPEAVYFGRGPFTPQDILDSRMVADPFHLLDCSMTSEGGCALVLTTADRARDLAEPARLRAGREQSTTSAPPTSTLRPGTWAATGDPTWSPAGSGAAPPSRRSRWPASGPTTSTSASSTTRSRSRSSASSRRSASARRARAATS